MIANRGGRKIVSALLPPPVPRTTEQSASAPTAAAGHRAGKSPGVKKTDKAAR